MKCYANYKKINLFGENNPNYGNKWNDEQSKKCGIKRKENIKNGITKIWSTGLTKESDERVLNISQRVIRLHKEKNNYGMKNRKHSVETKLKMRLNNYKNKGLPPPALGKHWVMSDEQKIKIGNIKRGLYAGDKNPMYGKIKRPVKPVEYKGILFRSSWEAEVAKKMDEFNLLWSYESKRFHFNHKKFSYLPDFYIFDWSCFLEVKGYYDLESSLKIQSFVEYTFRKFLIVDKHNYYDCIKADSCSDFEKKCEILAE
jgi:hypothetical protein